MLFRGFILDEAQEIGLSDNLFCNISMLKYFMPTSLQTEKLGLLLTQSIDLSDYSCLVIEVYNIHTAKILLYPETIFYGKV